MEYRIYVEVTPKQGEAREYCAGDGIYGGDVIKIIHDEWMRYKDTSKSIKFEVKKL